MKKILAAGMAAVAAVCTAAVDAGAAIIGAFDDEQHQPKPKKKAGHGVKLAAARLKAHRAAQAKRVKDAPEPTITRQQRRQQERRADKMPVGARQDLWHKAKGLPAIKPRRKGGAHA